MKKKLQGLLGDRDFSELLKGGLASLIVRVLGISLGFTFNWLVTKIYGTSELGMLMTCIAILSLISLLSRFGLDTAFLKFVSRFKKLKKSESILEVQKKSIWLIVILSILLSLILFILSERISTTLFDKPQLTNYIRLVSLGVLPMSLYLFYSEGLRGLKQIAIYSFIQNASRFLFATIILVLIYFGFIANDNINSMHIFIGSILLTCALSFFLWQKHIKKYSRQMAQSGILEGNETKTSLKNILSLSTPLLLASSTIFLIKWTDTMVLTVFGSDQDVAIYNVAFKFAALSKLSLIAINSISAPKFAEYGDSTNNFEPLGNLVKQATKLIFWTSIPIILIIFLMPKTLLGIYGLEFEFASTCLVILTLGHFISAISGPVGSLLQMTGNQKLYQNILLISTFINITLNIILIPWIGIEGAAIASFSSIVFTNLTAVIFVKLRYGFFSIYIPFLIK